LWTFYVEEKKLKNEKSTLNRVRGWLPKETSLPSTQRVRLADYFVRSTVLRLVYGVMLAVLLVTPFGVYHSRVEPYVTGALWGYQLPVGYIGLLLGITAVLYPVKLRSRKFSLLLAFTGLALLASFIFAPKDYLINLFNGTSFSPNQIDIDFSLGNLAVLVLSLASLFAGVASLTFSHQKRTR
jgi:hypothetical protein